MEKQTEKIRNTVRAVIIRDGKLLLLKKYCALYGERYALPGGAQEVRETLQQALLRECIEEIDCVVEIGDIRYVADFFKQKQLPQVHTRQQLEILFQCNIPDSYLPRNGIKPDKHQVGVVWMALQELPRISLSPIFLAELLGNVTTRQRAVYLGVIT